MTKNYLKIALLCFLSITLFNCEGEDGANGINGINGIDGISGENGANGENGVGFDELTQFGSIKVTFTGTRPDDVPFNDTAEFKFTPIEGDQLEDHSGIVIDEDEISYRVFRFLSTPDDSYQESTLGVKLDIINPGQEDESKELFFAVDDYAIISNDFKYVVLDEGEYNHDDDEISNFSITNYSFNEETNNLVFSFFFVVDGDSNDTGNELTISGDVNVTVLENVSLPGDTPPFPF
ncbi:hypothetical protein ABW636_03520 [Aquimarina sp. 2201CG1-2-11]|uniref:hypothetical protein n=1 Tax=Aquimarina discodermiae TaxID=3231043 RepID=UPI0034627C95